MNGVEAGPLYSLVAPTADVAFGMDAGTISALLIAMTSLLGWLVTQTQARSRALRAELRSRRQGGLLMSRYIYRLEEALAKRDLPLPEKPEGLDEMMDGDNQW